jgi:hypothetical protein
MRLPLAVLALALCAAAARAQDNPNVAYQNALLARPLTPAAKAFCDQAGLQAGTPAYAACKVTRLALADLAAGLARGFPPMTDPHYASKAELNQLFDLMTKYGG